MLHLFCSLGVFIIVGFHQVLSVAPLYFTPLFEFAVSVCAPLGRSRRLSTQGVLDLWHIISLFASVSGDFKALSSVCPRLLFIHSYIFPVLSSGSFSSSFPSSSFLFLPSFLPSFLHCFYILDSPSTGPAGLARFRPCSLQSYNPIQSNPIQSNYRLLQGREILQHHSITASM